MKLTKATIYLMKIGGRHPVLVELETDEGITGVGEAAVAYGTGGTAAAGMIKDLAEQYLPGQDPFRIEKIWSMMYDHTFWAKGGGTITFAGMSAIETALWDIKGKALNVPVYELLGGMVRDGVRVYANGWSFRANTPDEFAKAAEQPLKDGYDAIKMYPLQTPLDVGTNVSKQGIFKHVEHRTITREFEELAFQRVKAVRDAIGWDIDLLIDMSASLTVDTVTRLGRRYEELKPYFFEEPVDPFDVEALKKVSDNVKLPIAVGERLYTRYGFRPVMDRMAADILQPDIGNTGGIMETKKIATMAEAYSMRVQPHVCASPVSSAAALHLDASMTNFLIQEIYPYRVDEHYAVVDHTPENDIKNSWMPVSDRPGLGLELVRDRVKDFVWAECDLAG